ncbi:MAG: PhnD/SsuA/transferrin family substrate-binding protein, partial [Microbacteriaceae bacterium]|nr:PhnD/SsuA/transferrin family substrate-binding protein [Microbacteriaceae bacterium]
PAPTGGSDAPAAAPERLVLLMTPSDEKSLLEEQGAVIAELLTEQLGIPVEVQVPDDYAAVVTALGTGQADIAFTAPALTVQTLDEGIATPILQVTRDGSRSYVTQWMTNDPDRFCETDVVSVPTEVSKDGASAGTFDFKFCNGVDTAEYGDEVGFDALSLLSPDDPISFVDAGSTSGYKFPVTQLQLLGVIDSPEDLTAATFAGGHPASVLAVARGEAVVGTSFDDARTTAVLEEPAVEDVVVFAWSTPIPNDGVVVSTLLSEEWVEKIKAALLTLPDSEAGATALFDSYEVDGFADADLEALDVVRQVGANFD